MVYPLHAAPLRRPIQASPFGPPRETTPGHLSAGARLAARDDAAPADDQSEQKLASLSFSISTIELGRPTLLALEVAWWRSRAERLPRGMDEAVGRGARSAPRVQQQAGLHWHGTNSRRRSDGNAMLIRMLDSSSLGCCCFAILHTSSINDLSRSSDRPHNDCSRSQAVVHLKQSGRRVVSPRTVHVGCLGSQSRWCCCLGCSTTLQQARRDNLGTRARSCSQFPSRAL